MQKIYGCDIFIAPPPKYRNIGNLPAELYRSLWKKRTSDEWIKLSRKFNFTDIIVPVDWNLHLPQVTAGSGYKLYTATNAVVQ